MIHVVEIEGGHFDKTISNYSITLKHNSKIILRKVSIGEELNLCLGGGSQLPLELEILKRF